MGLFRCRPTRSCPARFTLVRKNFLLVLYQLQILYPPKRDHPLGDPLAVLFEYLFVLYSDFFSFYGKKVLFPGGGATEMLPYGVPFESLIFYILPYLHFLGFKLTGADRPFFSPSIFYPPWREPNEMAPLWGTI